MVIENDSIELRNVVSGRYSLHYSQFPEALEDFCRILEEKNLTPTGTLFYSLNNVPADEQMAVEVFAAVEENYVPENDIFSFHSYFTVKNMIMTYYSGNIEKRTEWAYAELLQFLEENELEMASPFFHFFRGDLNFQYVELKVGVQ
ncbi:DUF5085 family protein [Sporolactobacillus sp. CQH2019]|uniref:DUF5085 family protein n=1 Tax=Sporolactobacillus sp. CQH2019 TaxID=3023512 RepID=UPI0023682853|nr:DUF5085 family protein [Sporolactobacillus sp. CQH2019]MDD9149872.1 DUF5085 family protein [Sporolactobacillus sp. CQH2019]